MNNKPILSTYLLVLFVFFIISNITLIAFDFIENNNESTIGILKKIVEINWIFSIILIALNLFSPRIKNKTNDYIDHLFNGFIILCLIFYLSILVLKPIYVLIFEPIKTIELKNYSTKQENKKIGKDYYLIIDNIKLPINKTTYNNLNDNKPTIEVWYKPQIPIIYSIKPK